jgi:hypothetical protein
MTCTVVILRNSVLFGAAAGEQRVVVERVQ